MEVRGGHGRQRESQGQDGLGTFHTYKMTNFRGLVAMIGKRVKHMTKQAKAARLQAAKTSNLSHLLTATHVSPVIHEAQCLHHMQKTRHAPKI
jgi:hypothetical protein